MSTVFAPRSPRRGGGPRRGADPGIVRVRLPSTGGGSERAGYRATARLPQDVLRRVFFDADHGGTQEGSRAAARAWRAQQLADAALPDPPNRRLVLKPQSDSGIVGVFLRSPRHHRGSAAWVAYYETSAGERRSRSFSVGRHGAEARALAVEQRRAWERDDLGCALPSNYAATRLAGDPT